MPRLRTLAVAALLLAAPAQAQVSIDWVTIGSAGNAADTEVMVTDGTSGYGSVGVVYRMGRYEVTNSQYAAFLNAVAASDPGGLYNPRMGDPPLPFDIAGGITRSGSPGSYTYAAVPGLENLPVNFVSFYDALRFANWLHNGQPTGAQDDSTTEDGAYTLTAEGIANNSIVRNAGAAFFLPSENEWYKAAFYRQGGLNAGYWDSPTRTNTFNLAGTTYLGTVCDAPTAANNRANCGNAVADLVPVGSYTSAGSPWGTYDQGGNVGEWNEAIINTWSRGVRGGAFSNLQLLIGQAASVRGAGSPDAEGSGLGFRVASLPVSKVAGKAALPASVPAVGPMGLLLAALGLAGAGALRRLRA
jgi:formylglycine-generating enzyme required for sulfatase activity